MIPHAERRSLPTRSPTSDQPVEHARAPNDTLRQGAAFTAPRLPSLSAATGGPGAHGTTASTDRACHCNRKIVDAIVAARSRSSSSIMITFLKTLASPATGRFGDGFATSATTGSEILAMMSLECNKRLTISSGKSLTHELFSTKEIDSGLAPRPFNRGATYRTRAGCSLTTGNEEWPTLKNNASVATHERAPQNNAHVAEHERTLRNFARHIACTRPSAGLWPSTN